MSVAPTKFTLIINVYEEDKDRLKDLLIFLYDSSFLYDFQWENDFDGTRYFYELTLWFNGPKNLKDVAEVLEEAESKLEHKKGKV